MYKKKLQVKRVEFLHIPLFAIPFSISNQEKSCSIIHDNEESRYFFPSNGKQSRYERKGEPAISSRNFPRQSRVKAFLFLVHVAASFHSAADLKTFSLVSTNISGLKSSISRSRNEKVCLFAKWRLTFS